MNAAKWWGSVLLCLTIWSAPAFADSDSDSWQRLMSAGETAYQQGQYPEAEKDFAAAVGFAEKFGSDDTRLARSLDELAFIYGSLGRYDDAEPLYKHALTT